MATYVMENRSRIIVAAGFGRPDKKTDCEETLRVLRRIKSVHRIRPESVGTDKGYGAREFIYHVMEEASVRFRLEIHPCKCRQVATG